MVTEFHPVLAWRNGDALESIVAALNRYWNFVDCGIPTGKNCSASLKCPPEGERTVKASFRLPGS